MTTRRLLAAFSLLLLLTALPATAQIPVTDVVHIGVSIQAYIQHLVRYAEMLVHTVQLYQQITNQISQIKNQVQALKKLSNPGWRDISPVLEQLDYLMRQGAALAYSLEGIDGLFRETFPGIEPYHSYATEHTLQAYRTLETLRTSLLTVHQQAQQAYTSLSDLARIKGQMASTHGHQEALELNSTLSAWQGEQMVLLQQTQHTASNIAAITAAYTIDRQAQIEETYTQLVEKTLGASASALGSFSYSTVPFFPEWMPR